MLNNIFITAVGGDIACSTLRCIVQGYKYDKLVGCDIHEYVQGRMYVDNYILVPKFSSEKEYLECIKNTCMKYSISHFFPMTETEIIIADKNRDFFRQNKIHVMINNTNTINIASSKYKTAKYLESNGIKVPKTYYLDEYNGELMFPLIMKADRSCGSKQVSIINNETEFNEKKKTINKPVIQQYIGTPDEEYTMGVFSDGKNIKYICFKRKLGFGGMSVYVETVKDTKFEDIANKISKALNIQGSINIQLRKDNDEYYVFEINPRISSTAGFRHQLGFKDVIWWLNLVNGDSVNCEYKMKAGIIGIKILDELVFV